MNTTNITYPQHLAADGTPASTISLTDIGLGKKYVVLFCFQSWCPGCHSAGFPTLQALVDEFGTDNEKISFAVIQTTFEGHSVNTFEALQKERAKYTIAVPFIQDSGDDAAATPPQTMAQFGTRGTPWFILINKKGEVEHGGFHIDPEKTIAYLKQQLAQSAE